MDIVTNEANGNLQIPDELILYLADGEYGAGLSVAGPSYDGVSDNAFISAAAGPLPDAANTWAADGSDHIRFHIGGGNPFYEGSFSFDAVDGFGVSGSNTIGVQNFATAKAGSYWTLDGTDSAEILLGLDGRNQIDGVEDSDIDTITLNSLLTGADIASQAAIDGWLTLTSGSVTKVTDTGFSLGPDAAGTIDLGGGNEITFVNIEQIDYALVG